MGISSWATVLVVALAAPAPSVSSRVQSHPPQQPSASGTDLIQSRTVSCCNSLSSVFGSKVALPDSASYNSSVSSYWAQQATLLTPGCVLTPKSAQDVKAALKVLRTKSCQFAVRGGGHGFVQGVSNIEGGVTIDLRGLDEISLSKDKSTVTVGAGQSWGNVFSHLDPHGLSVSGGRHAPVGVGGSTLGGGFGHFSPKVGFACDNVVEYEVVLACGSIVTASAKKFPDLFKALKGGGSNFGIVTKFTLRTFELGEVWGGSAFFMASDIAAHQDAFYEFAADPDYDENAGLILNYAYTPDSGPLITNMYAYAKPVVNPTVFKPFTSTPGQMFNDTKIHSAMGPFSVSQAQGSPAGNRQHGFAVSFKTDLKTIRDVWDLFVSSTNLVAQVPSISWSISLEPIPKAIIEQGRKRGGNALGLDTPDFPAEGIVLLLLSATYSPASTQRDVEKVQAAANQLRSSIVIKTKQNGVFHPYVDMNHADRNQDPIDSYGGLVNRLFLRATALKYDPLRVFQKLMPGGFKV